MRVLLREPAPQAQCGRHGQGGRLLCCLLSLCIPCLPVFVMRSEARERYGIDGSTVDDAVCSFCCSSCVNCQTAVEIKGRGDAVEFVKNMQRKTCNNICLLNSCRKKYSNVKKMLMFCSAPTSGDATVTRCLHVSGVDLPQYLAFFRSNWALQIEKNGIVSNPSPV